MTSRHASDAANPTAPRLGRFPWPQPWLVAGLAALAAFLAGDLAADVAAGVGWEHLLLDLAAFAVALIGIAGAAARLRRRSRDRRGA